MSKKFSDDEITLDLAKYVYNGAKSFAEGIYVPNHPEIDSSGHPCNWDFIDFEDIENEDEIESYPFEDWQISNGYGSEEFTNCTLLEILKKVHGQVAFELNQIDW
jgi:hypothetical protein